jgi:hypothetical protein
MDLASLLDKKIGETNNEIDKMEFIAIKSILKNQYTDLLKMFGYD